MSAPRTAYLAGPMSGRALYNFPAFDAWRDFFSGRGVAVVSPADVTRKYWSERFGREFDPATDRAEWGDDALCELLKRDLVAVCDCEAIILLPEWETSRGAAIELSVARALGKTILVAAEWRDGAA